MMHISAYAIKKSFTQAQEHIEVLKEITASFEAGKSYAITGPSGSGKSTFMHLLAGIDTPTSGTISYEGQNIQQFSDEERRLFLNKSIGLVFQQPYLMQEFSVLENIMLKGLIAEQSAASCKEQAHELLQKIGLSHKADHHPYSLSGGEQQRVALARALFNKPSFLLADEPTGNLDVATGKAIVDLMTDCQKEWGIGLIISSHDAYVAEKMNIILRMENGQLQIAR
jgi:lipoprotein-releasing system ATP-binding protein